MISMLPKPKKYDRELIARFDNAREIITSIRTVRKEKQVLNRDPVELNIRTEGNSYDSYFLPVILKLCNLSGVKFVSGKPDNSAAFMVSTTEFFIPLPGVIDAESEKAKIMADLDYYKGFLNSVMTKLNNERFVQNAPPTVLELEKRKKADTESRIRSLEEALESFSDK
jgi:valyl-tRNA synthetase